MALRNGGILAERSTILLSEPRRHTGTQQSSLAKQEKGHGVGMAHERSEGCSRLGELGIEFLTLQPWQISPTLLVNAELPGSC